MLDLIEKFNVLTKPFFVSDGKKIIIIATHNASQLIIVMFSAGEMKRLLAVNFSEEGSNQREVEESAWIRIFLTSVKARVHQGL